MKIKVLKRIAAGLFFLSVAVLLAHAVLLGAPWRICSFRTGCPF